MDGIEFGDDMVSYIFMILVYSGLGSWLLNRLTRSRDAERQIDRQRVAETLQLLDSVQRAKESLASGGAAPERLATLEDMRGRLSDEATQMVAELNVEAEEELRDPSSRYVVIPTPRSPFAVLTTLVFAVSVYMGLMFWLTVLFKLWQTPGFAKFATDADQRVGLFLVAGGFVLFLLAALARWAAFQNYRRVVEHHRQEAAKALPSAP